MSATAKDYEKILTEPYEYICQVKGKEIRVKLIEAFNAWLKIPEDKKDEIKKITQMLHNASLIIDDIEDNSILRRGVPVAHRVFGVASSLNSGNYIYFAAMECTLKLGHPQAMTIFTKELLDLHRGQGKDIYWRDCYVCPEEEEYKEMVRQKTGGLFRLAVDLMQLFSDNKSDFGPLVDTLGLFFQIRDDYANLMSEEYTNNKSFCEDLTEGKFSFPIIHGIKSDKSSKLMNILRQRPTELDIKKYFLQCLEELGSLKYTVEVLVDLEKKALTQISSLGGNRELEVLVGKLSALYRDIPSPIRKTPQLTQ